MTVSQAHIIRCAHCHGRHAADDPAQALAAVRACAAGGVAVRAPWNPLPPAHQRAAGAVEQKRLRTATRSQVEYVRKLGGDPLHAVKLTVAECSTYIQSLQEGRRTMQRPQTKIPLAMLQSLDKGYYAARLDETRPFVFFRVSKPKSGKFANAIKIQTQHGPEYKLNLAVWPSGSTSLYDARFEDELIVACIDQLGCAMNYANEIGRCCRCNKELTDAHSRWYGIGPECVKYWPHMISAVEDSKGPYRPGV